MVGVPRNNGCSTCVNQRVKCDLTKPACQRCMQLRLKCPGYPKSTKFVYEIPRMKSKKGDGQGAFHHVRELSRPRYRTTNPPSQNPMWEVSVNRFTGFEVPRGIVEATYHDIQRLTLFLQNSTPSDKCTDVHFTKKWLNLIPARVGSSYVLDNAIRCLANHYVGSISGSEKALKVAKVAYGSALLSLQKAVADPIQAMSSDTVCATMIMAIYEQFACTARHSWVAHAGGSSKLVRIQGPDWQRSDFDRSMILAHRAQWTMEAFMQGTTCFLDTPEWHSYFEQPGMQDASNSLVQLCNEFNSYLIRCPGLTKESYVLRRANKEGQASNEQITNLVNRVIQLLEQLRNWWQRFETLTVPPKEVPSRTQDEQFPIVYQYDGSYNIFFPASYRGAVILLDQIVQELIPELAMKAATQSLVIEVCKIAEYAYYEAGVLGPSEIAFGLRMAFMVADLPTKVWIKYHLDKMSRLMPAMRHQVSLEKKVEVVKDF